MTAEGVAGKIWFWLEDSAASVDLSADRLLFVGGAEPTEPPVIRSEIVESVSLDLAAWLTSAELQ